MEYRSLEINLLSAEGIKDVNMFGKMDVYAVVFISGYPNSKKMTRVDKNSGSSPRWNQKLDFTIDERSISYPGTILVIKLKAKKSLGDRSVGEVSIPFSELFKNGDGGTSEKLVEYQVRTSSGKAKGTVKLSYKLGDKVVYNNPATAYPPTEYKHGHGSTSTPAPPPVMAYPPKDPGTGYGYPPPVTQGHYGGYPQHSGQIGGYPQPGYGYAPPPQPAGYGYAPPPQPAGYGYAPPPQPGYGYQQPPRNNKMGMGLGLGAGLLGGMLIGDMISDANDYNDGYDDAMGDMGGDFDF